MENYVVTPSSEVTFYKNPCELTKSHQLTFSSINTQKAYFNSLDKLVLEDFTYQRREAIIRVPYSLDLMEQYNYVSYCNEEYNDRLFYAYITDMNYINDSLTAVYIELDVYQTYQFDFQLKKSFVERMHVGNDRVGLWTAGEEFETGELNDIDITHIGFASEPTTTMVQGRNAVCIVCSEDIMNWSGVLITNGIATGLTFYYMSIAYIDNFKAAITAKGKTDQIITNMYMIPYKMFNAMITRGYLSQHTYHSGQSDEVKAYVPNVEWQGEVLFSSHYLDKKTTGQFKRVTESTGYTPHNNKLYGYPFNYAVLSNNVGGSIDFKYELMNGSTNIQVSGVPTEGCSIKAYALNYNSVSEEHNYNYALDCMKYPVCAWTNDSYTNWLTQNAVNMEWREKSSWLGFAGNTLGSVASAFSNPVGALGSVINGGVDVYKTAVETTLENRMAKTIANGVNGSNNATINYSNDHIYTIYYKRIDGEHAQMIDSYFDKYGYRIGKMWIPETNTRPNWNYVKTIECVIDDTGTDPIPEYYKNRIKELFNNGITLWHNANNFLNYNANNLAPTR